MGRLGFGAQDFVDEDGSFYRYSQESMRVAEIKNLHGPGDGHEDYAAFFLNVAFFRGSYSFDESDDEDHGEFQSL